MNNYYKITMEIKKKTIMTLMIALMAIPVVGQKSECCNSQCQSETEIFLYSPDEKQGFHVASPADDGNFADLGQLFSSDYSRWGSEKRMYSPFVCHLDNGGYVAVFQVNDYSPCFAVTRSDNLVAWRPQDYPRMSVAGCLAPVVRRGNNNLYSVIFKTKDGNYRKTTTDADFRHFSADVTATADEYLAAKGSCVNISVGGKLFSGCKLTVPSCLVGKLKSHFSTLAENEKRNSETLVDDEKLRNLLGGKAINAFLTIDGKRQKDISDKLVGVFFEDISYAADGGLYAELIQNRDFEYNSNGHKGWTSSTSWRSSSGILSIRNDMPLSRNNSHYVVISSDTLFNTGWDGIVVKKDAKYDFSFFANNISGKSKNVLVALYANGRIIASSTISTAGRAGEWKKYEAVLTATENADKAELMIVPLKKNDVALDMISLFPQDTYNGRRNGLRKDLAQTIADIHPKFIRFPGGCMSHGDGIDNIYHWWHTVGPLEERKPDSNIWRYHQTRGLGFYEYFQFCEDIQAEPLPVLAAGVPCQNSGADANGYGGQQGGIPMEEMQAYVQELFDLIEWANGDPATNKWAKMRADAGHPAPFNLKYIGIGNEDLISTAFEERCLMICKAIKERYPDITICGTVGPFHYPSSDYVEGWTFANANKNVIDMVDEHYYESVGWFLNNQHYYDKYDRKGPKVYLGEYAARMGKRYLDCALAEAVHLCNIERNADVVSMTSYAPLLSKNGHSNWNPDMLYFDNKNIQKTPNYETQRLFSTYSGNRYVESALQIDSVAGHRVATSVVRDTKTGQAFLKVVNVLPVELNIDVTSTNLPLANIVRYEGYSGKPGQSRVSVERGTYSKTPDNVLHISLPPYSLRVIML